MPPKPAEVATGLRFAAVEAAERAALSYYYRQRNNSNKNLATLTEKRYSVTWQPRIINIIRR